MYRVLVLVLLGITPTLWAQENPVWVQQLEAPPASPRCGTGWDKPWLEEGSNGVWLAHFDAEGEDCPCLHTWTHLVIYDAERQSVLAQLPLEDVEACDGDDTRAAYAVVALPSGDLAHIGPEHITRYTPDPATGEYAASESTPTCSQGHRWTWVQGTARVFGCKKDGEERYSGRYLYLPADPAVITPLLSGVPSEPLDAQDADETRPLLELELVSLLGSYDKRMYRKMMRHHMASFVACARPGVEVTLNVRFVIDLQGRVPKARAQEHSFDRKAEQCLLDAITGVTFPSGRHDGIIQVEQRFTFTPLR